MPYRMVHVKAHTRKVFVKAKPKARAMRTTRKRATRKRRR